MASAATTRRSPMASWSRDRVEGVIWGTARRLTILFIAVITVLPAVYLVVMSVRPLASIMAEPLRILPTGDEFSISTYVRALTSPEAGGYGLATMMFNTVVVALGAVVLTLLFSMLGAYALARFDFPGRRFMGGLLLATYLFPGIVLAIPLFSLFVQFGLRGHLASLMVVYMAQTVPIAIFMLRIFFRALPESIEEAAQVDGCNLGQMIRRIVLPLSVPSLIATAMYVTVVAWNELLYALLFLVEARENWTVSLGIAMLSNEGIPRTVLLAACVAVSVPVVVVFFLMQRRFVEGLTAGVEKA